MNNLAEKLNETLAGTSAMELLSDYGRRMYVPKGIIVQSAEAKQKATNYNATIGVALDHGTAMFIPSIKAQFADTMKVGEIFPYAPMGGNPNLRKIWKDEMYLKNPSLAGKAISLPIVTSGLTNALSLVCSLFLDEGDSVVLPDMYWENYNLILDEQRQAKKIMFPNFNENDGFNLAGLDKALTDAGKKAVVILNFPNNPTGYTPTEAEANEIAKLLVAHAEAGQKLAVISDDAYFGLFFEKDVCKESLFAKIANSHENILAIKCDAATKEEMVWGFRIAFVTFGCKGFDDAKYDALMQKTMGALRGSLSCCTTSGQSILLKGMADSTYHDSKKKGIEIVGERYHQLKNALDKYQGNPALKALPFNSGYFMSFECKCDAEELRQSLLNNYGTGVIRLDDHHIRLAFSSIDVENINGLVDTVYKAASELC